MTFMAGGQDFLPRHPCGSPGSPPLQEAVNCCVALSLFLIASGDQVGDGRPVPRDGDSLAMLHGSKDLPTEIPIEEK